MKKLLALGCCVIALQSLSQIQPSSGNSTSDGKRVLFKAIAVMMNVEGNRKMPQRQVHVPNLESPRC